MEPPPAEFTFICIDNSERVQWNHHIYDAQLDAVKFYCETLLKSNSDNVVCLYLMTSSRILVGPTSDLQQILRHLQYVPCKGDVRFSYALGSACSTFSHSHIHMKRRLLMFVASRIDLQSSQSKSYGRKLKERGVALNVFNFFLLKTDTYHYMRDHLDTLVTVVNDNGNSRIEDVDESCICDVLSKSILKENLHYLEKKAPGIEYGNLSKMTRNEKNRAAAGVRYIEISDIPGINKMFGPDNYNDVFAIRLQPGLRGHSEKTKSAADGENGNLSKKTTHISVKENQEKAEEDVSVKQELELSCKEKNKAAAQGICNECVKPNLGWFHKEKTKSAADTSERSAGEKKNREKMLSVQTRVRAVCNEKSQAAAEYGKHSPLVSLERMKR